MTAKETAQNWYELFSVFADDLYPGRYTKEFVLELAEQAKLIKAVARQKESTLLAHNYLYPEFHELTDLTGDSLALSLSVEKNPTKRVDFGGVFFMGETAKIIAGPSVKVFTQDTPEKIGCSLVFGTDNEWVKKWKELNKNGVIVSYINSSAYLKSISEYICTSRNTAQIIVRAIEENPGSRILIMPDKFLGLVMKAQAIEILNQKGIIVDPEIIEIYQHSFGGFHASCYVHEKIGEKALEEAFEKHPEAELMIHPECGCASSCLFKLNAGVVPYKHSFFLSTDQMINHAKSSKADKFIVATEKGMVYKLRKMIPQKHFIPVSFDATCKYMKENTLEKLLNSLQNDRIEIVICDDCCDGENPFQDQMSVHIPRSTAEKAKKSIKKMLEIS